MQFKKTSLRLLLILFPVSSFAQTTFLPQGDKQNILLERLEIKSKTDSILNFSKTKPFSRQNIIYKVFNLYGLTNHPLTDDNPILTRDSALARQLSMSRVDMYNLRSSVLNNQEWIGNAPGGIRPPEFAS